LYQKVVKYEELFWYQKSREKWVKLEIEIIGFFILKQLFVERNIKFKPYIWMMELGALR